MKFYKVKVEANLYQWIMPEVKESAILEYTTFNCTLKDGSWNKIKWYVFNPKLKAGNFFNLGSGGGFAFDEDVFNSDLFTLLEMAGQILPITLDNINLYIMNITECVNLLNHEKTKRSIYEDGTMGKILEYSFQGDRLSESTLFKIPETCKGEILTYTGVKDEEDEFKKLYEKLGFTGLYFEEIGTDVN